MEVIYDMKYRVHNRLRLLRKRARLTQLRVAELLSIERATYCNYENEVRTPPLEVLIKLADLYHVTLDYLLRADLSDDSSLFLSEPLLPEEQTLLTSYRKLSSAGQRSLLQFAAYSSAVDDYTGKVSLQPDISGETAIPVTFPSL